MINSVTVLIADDVEIVRFGLRELFKDIPSISVVGEASCGPSTIEAVTTLKPDVLVIELCLPLMDGLEVSSVLKTLGFEPRILLIASDLDEERMRKALAAGILGVIPKKASKADLAAAVQKVARGEPAVHESILQSLKEKAAQARPENLYHVTRREHEILKLIAGGLTSIQIADRLFISPRTVDTHRTNLLQKLQINNTASLVRWALDHRLV